MDIFRRWAGGLVRYRDLGSTVFTPETVALPPYVGPLTRGRFYMSGTGKLTMSGNGHVRILMRNPVDSERNIHIDRFISFVTSNTWMDIWVNPTTGLPTGPARTPLNAMVGGGVASIADFRADVHTSIPIGGTGPSVQIGLGANQRGELILPPIVLTPGTAVGFGFQIKGASEAGMSAYWWEDDRAQPRDLNDG